MTDLAAIDHGTVIIIRPESEDGRAWMREHLRDVPGWARMGGGVACDHGPAAAIIDGAHAAGLAVAVTR